MASSRTIELLNNAKQTTIYARPSQFPGPVVQEQALYCQYNSSHYSNITARCCTF